MQSTSPQVAPPSTPPVVLTVQEGTATRRVRLLHTPFTIGRGPDRDLVLPHKFISRQHAQIVEESGRLWIEDTHSRHGLLRNGQPVRRSPVAIGDRIQLGGYEGPVFTFERARASDASIKDILHASNSESDSDLSKLNWLLEAARRLNATGGVDEILASLLEITLSLTKWERGYVFLCEEENRIRLASARDSNGEILLSEDGLSHTAIARALDTVEPFILTDTNSVEAGAHASSIIANNIRAIIAMPLRRWREGNIGEPLGVLYLDSRLTPGVLSETDHGLLRTVAAEAATLVENARLAKAEEDARHDREELAFAAGIQQRLMSVHLPSIEYATFDARNLPCREIGGDFFDVLIDPEGIAVVATDVSGKGASAAIIASTLQGMVYSQLSAGTPLATIARTVNTFLCAKQTGKYATMVLARLHPSGRLQYINCGHIAPVVMRRKGRSHLPEVLDGGNVPVGLLENAVFTAGEADLLPGDTLILASDGITEAENAAGEFFGTDRFLAAARTTGGELSGILSHVQKFCGGTPATDDRTIVCLRYSPRSQPSAPSASA